MTTKTRTKGTKETNRTKKMNGTKGKGKEEKQLLRKMRPKPMRTKRKTLLGRGPKDDKLGGALSELLEFLFELNIMFITDEFTNGQPYSNLLVYFGGILGFSADARSFRPAKQVTPYLSGLIYDQWLLFLKYALPFCAYKHLGIARRPRRGHLERLDKIRLWYMTAGSLTPLSEFQSLRDFGQAHFPDRPTFFSLPVE